ncbi:unnamed protein product [Heterobilharzia americana]|nr:unnamed protein product [Heterobilharzia americana]
METEWQVDQLTEFDEIGDDSRNRMYYITLYKQRLHDIHSHENLLTEFTNSRLKLHQNRLDKYRKFIEHYQRFDEWLINTEVKLNYVIEDIAGKIEHLIPEIYKTENEQLSMSIDKEYNQTDVDSTIESLSINKKDNSLLLHIEEINKLWLSIITNAENQLNVIDSLFLTIQKDIHNSSDLETKINTVKDHIFSTLRQKIDNLLENLKEYQNVSEEFWNDMTKMQIYLTDQEKRLFQFTSMGQMCYNPIDISSIQSKSSSIMIGMLQLPDSQDDKLFCVESLNKIYNDLNSIECLNLIQILNNSYDRLISILNTVRQMGSSHRSIVTSNDRLEKHLNYIHNYMIRLKKHCENLLRYWQLAVDNHTNFNRLSFHVKMNFQGFKQFSIKAIL